ncbi:TolC family protein [Reinekea sp.]|jgi:outer membrane protein TolC|uniref:TolC family protein n=1 Tax=Reinekea sp. TaxID=1970455 RepID=UPI0039899F37
MKPIYSFLVLAFLTNLASGLLANQTLSEGWSQLLEEHAGLAAQNRQVAAMEAQLSVSKSLRLPDVKLTGQWNALDQEVGVWFDSSALMPGGSPIYMPVQDQQYVDAEVTVTLPLYTGGKLKAAALASQGQLQEQVAVQQQYIDQLFVAYIERYLTASLAHHNANIRQLAADNLQQHYLRAVRMQEEGTIAYTQRLSAQVERDKARRQLNQATVDVQLSNSAYQALFASEVPLPAANLLFVENEPLLVTELRNQGIEYAPALKQINAKQLQAQAGLKSIKAQWYPSVAAFAQFELFPDDLTDLDPQWVAGIALEWQLFGRGNRLAESHHYAALAQAADFSAIQAQRDLSVLIEKTIFEVDSARSAFNALQSSKALAAENLRLQEKAFLQGINTSLDIIDAEILTTGIALESQKALFDFYLAQAKLSALMGQHEAFLVDLQHAQKTKLIQQ